MVGCQLACLLIYGCVTVNCGQRFLYFLSNILLKHTMFSTVSNVINHHVDV